MIWLMVPRLSWISWATETTGLPIQKLRQRTVSFHNVINIASVSKEQQYSFSRASPHQLGCNTFNLLASCMVYISAAVPHHIFYCWTLTNNSGIQSPSKTLYYWNAPPGITEAQINELFTDADVKPPSKIKQFPSRSKPIILLSHILLTKLSYVVGRQMSHQSNLSLLLW